MNPNQPTRYCDNCGAEVRAQARFCFACGQRLQPGTASVPAAIGLSAAGSLTGTLHSNYILKQRYRITGQVGRGGFGAVYRAEDTGFDSRVVAVKEMSQASLNPQEIIEATNAFRSESRLLSGLTHPNLPRIYDNFSETGRWYLVMDFIEGQTLEDRLEKQPQGHLPFDEALDIAIQLCTVLGYLHNRQPPIIFRDLKPANVIITPEGLIYLIDFGIARLFKPGQAKDTTAFGSAGYAAPEQYGKAQTTPQADIYSLGATLHQMITGEDPSLSPFRFEPFRQSDPLHQMLWQLVERMIALEQSKRPASMAEVKAALQQIVAMRMTGPFVTAPFAAQGQGAGTLQPSAAWLGAPAQPPPGGWPGNLNQPPSAPSPAPTPVPTRANSNLSSRTLFTYREHKKSVLTLAWAPNGLKLASGSADGVIEIWEPLTGRTLTSCRGHKGHIYSLAWSRDSRYLASGSRDNTVRIWEVASGREMQVYSGHTSFVHAVAWSPDSQRLASASNDKTVQIWTPSVVGPNANAVVYRGHSEAVKSVAWAPDGKRLASGGKDSTLAVWQVPRNKSQGILNFLFSYRPNMDLRGYSQRIDTVGWSPDGKYLASGKANGAVEVWDTGVAVHPRHIYRDHSGPLYSLAWAPSGKFIAAGGREGAVYIWSSSDSRALFVYSGHSSFIHGVVWSPDGKYLASASNDKTVQVWQIVLNGGASSSASTSSAIR